MRISRERVADLHEGDVVTIRWILHPDVIVTGPLRPRGGGQWVGPVPVIGPSGEVSDNLTLTVVSRAPRPLYVNSDRTEPVAGDVVRIDFDEPYDDDSCVNVYLPDRARPHAPWLSIRHDEGMRYSSEQVLPGPTTKGRAVLLVDGETGQVVP